MNPINDQAPQANDGKQKVSNHLAVMQPGERVICEIKRHPFGILVIYGLSAVLLLVVAILTIGVAPHLSSDGSNIGKELGAVFLVVFIAAVAAYCLIASKVYWGNSWVVTTDSVTQITQTSLFNRQSSQLSLGNLEDVTAEQNGILAHMFNFGLIKVETAGERSKFQCQYCPNPNYYAQQILSAREAFEQNRRGQSEERLYREQSSYAPPTAPTQQPPAGPPPEAPQPPSATPIAPTTPGQFEAAAASYLGQPPAAPIPTATPTPPPAYPEPPQDPPYDHGVNINAG